MSMLINRWVTTKGFHEGAKVEAYKHSDGSIHYSFRDKFGRPANIENEAEAKLIIKRFRMEPVA